METRIEIYKECEKELELHPEKDGRIYPKHIEAVEYGIMYPDKDTIKVEQGFDGMKYHFLTEIIFKFEEDRAKRDSIIVRHSVNIFDTKVPDIINKIGSERAIFNRLIDERIAVHQRLNEIHFLGEVGTGGKDEE